MTVFGEIYKFLRGLFMNNLINIFGEKYEYDFLSVWIKYNRLKQGISQEALAYGICSPSHLSYFENGKKKLSSELITALLNKLKIINIKKLTDIGLIRQKFNKLLFEIESFDYEAAKITYTELTKLEPLLHDSPYSIEFNIYTLMYNILVERKSFSELKTAVIILDKIYSGLDENLQYLYLLITGKLLYHQQSHAEGIKRLEKAYRIKDTPWINYRLGVAYNENWEHLKSVVYLEKALNSYLLMGRYRNSLECHSFLGSSYTYLKIYDKAEFHLTSVLNGSDYFTLNKNIFGIYTNLANLYFNSGNYAKSIAYCKLAMNPPDISETDNRWLTAAWQTNEQPMLAACIYVEIHKKLNDVSKCKVILDKFLNDSYKNSIYYNYLYCLYLNIFYFDNNIFYNEITNIILPFYKNIGYLNITNKITLLLIEYLENRRKYKEANSLYKELLQL